MNGNHGFFKELKSKRSQPQEKPKFRWGETLATPKTDNAFPEMSVDKTPTAKALPSPKPTVDLPRTTTGHIDNHELKVSLAELLKSSRKQRA